jgi:glycerol transport system ATP-binding protein
VQVGCRPEFCTISASGGLPVTIRRVEDVGRHRIVRTDFIGRPLNVILPEGMALPTDTQVVFDPGHVGVFADDWRVSPKEAR